MYLILFPLSKTFPSLGGGGQRLPLHNPRPAKRQKVVFIQPNKAWTHPASPLTECTTCNNQVPIFAFRQHFKDCGAIDINSDTEEIEDILKQDDSEVTIEDILNLNTPSTFQTLTHLAHLSKVGGHN
jgi:hypothetical protein